MSSLSIDPANGGDNSWCNAFAELLKTNTTVKSLYIKCSVEESDISSLAVALVENTTLERLSLCSSSNDSTVPLCIALALNKSIQTLRVCDPGSLAPLILCKTLMQNTTISRAEIESNFEGAGITMLTKLIEHNESLVHLDISRCSIGDDGAIKLAKALETNNTLQTLILDSNGISTIGARALIESLKVNTTLQTIKMVGNPNSLDDMAEMKKYIIRNRSTHCVD